MYPSLLCVERFGLCRAGCILAACAALLLSSGCRRGNAEAPAPGTAEKRSAFSRFLSPETAPGYAWDGQYSKATIGLGIEAAYDRALEVLGILKFTINDDESKRQGASARIVAVSANKAAVQVALETRTAAETEVKVKVGATGDRGGSERILDEMQKGSRPAPAKKKQ